MTSADIINGCFEAGFGLLQWTNVRRLRRDRQVQGVNWQVTAFAAAWGLWNLYYYPSLGQWFSFSGGMVIVLANMVWVALAIVYSSAPYRRVHERLAQVQTAPFPHCDPRVLHFPGTCKVCDEYPTEQLQRLRDRVGFTGYRLPGFGPCPAEVKRSLEQINSWAGNQPRTVH